jgi:hypothetical protein
VSDADGPLSWRDVYAAVASSEARVLVAIGTLTAKLDADLGSVKAEVTALSGRVRDVENMLLVQGTRERSVVEVLGKGKTLALLLLSAIGAVLATLNAIAGISGQP